VSLMEFERVNAFYGRAQILREVSLSVAAGERVAVLGRNGVGKTTVVNALLGIAQVRGGEMRFGGTAVHAPRPFWSARAGIAVVPQGRRIVPNLTVRENLLLGAAVRRRGPWELNAVFDLFPLLRERAHLLGTALSGGQQQMLAIGRALMANPAVLVLDEPSEGLAPVIVDELAGVLIRLAAENTGILLIEQNIGLVRRIAERYCILSKGAVVEEGVLAALSAETLQRHIAI
jgi:branched-chain amino acid transport system ATP-binding protein